MLLDIRTSILSIAMDERKFSIFLSSYCWLVSKVPVPEMNYYSLPLYATCLYNVSNEFVGERRATAHV
jgi:hypothetical protein